ncbi:uncharacterized protein [Physcomitrium patens]|uniref:PTC1-like winged helix-turn-helix domain-containing protein n=1 Tax=Physcomitrium patens TaxID=3218 RepID=A0A7I4CQX2_PHYPA|nr:uncharacterized protein LOC112276528 isoform X2 [Physcomitrium patens]|eukprot:XP_024363687.1 uncharacterized protein LOC112276528 isoform X2 [Physcomitrella patens]
MKMLVHNAIMTSLRLHAYNVMAGACLIQGNRKRYTLHLDLVEALFARRLELNKNLAMSPRSSRRLLTGSSSGTDNRTQQVPHPKKRYWLTPPDPGPNCATALYDVATVALGASVDLDFCAASETARKKRKINGLLEGGMNKEEQVTRDLCNSFENGEPSDPRNLDVVPWRSTSNSSDGMNLRQSGLTSEEDADGNAPNDSALATVITAAELLTQLTCGRNADTYGQSPDVTSCEPFPADSRQASEQPIRWGIKKKVTYETRRSVDSCDLGLCTGLIRQFSDEEKAVSVTSAHGTPNQKLDKYQDSRPQNSFSPGKKWNQSSPKYPASSELYRQLRSSGDQAVMDSTLVLSSSTTHISRDQKQNKIPSSTRTVSGNILKLPKDMQGRWSSERYKSAQLKLIDIMHARKAVPGRPILRPALREEARKHIGDTGLLDHLLKHMTDTVVSTGERFRRRHNSEGAMEYWLEHPSLMELRKAAGVEDPSWIPPPGWKPGDKLSGRNWQINHGMTSSEAAEMKNLKETVEKLKSEMKVLCGSIKVSNQRGALTCSSVFHEKGSEGLPFRTEAEDDIIKDIRKDMTQFKTELTNMQQQFHEERKSGANLCITLERFQKLESEVLQMHESQKPQEEILSGGNQLDLEGQLQDVRKTVAVMQADVSCIMSMLGIVPPIKATPLRYPFDRSTPAKSMPLMLSTGEDTCVTHGPSDEPQCPGTSELVLHDFHVIPKLDVSMRQCTTLECAISSNNDGNSKEISAPYTEGLSRALSNYKLVNQPGQPANTQVDEVKNPTGSSMATQECAPPLAGENKQRRVQVFNTQNFKPIFKSQPTGFRICRPPGSFIWPSMLSSSQFPGNVPPMSRLENTEPRVEDGAGYSSPRSVSGVPFSPHMTSVKQPNYSARSIAECQVAATMAGMFGCMAPLEVAKLEMQGPRNTANATNSPRNSIISQSSQQSNSKFLPRRHTVSTGVDFSASPASEGRSPADQPQQTNVQKSTSVCPTKQSTWNLLNQKPEINNIETPQRSLPTLPLMTKGIVPSDKDNMSTATNSGHCSLPAGQTDPTLSLSLSLSVSPGMCNSNPALKKQKSI